MLDEIGSKSIRDRRIPIGKISGSSRVCRDWETWNTTRNDLYTLRTLFHATSQVPTRAVGEAARIHDGLKT
jgi:hypothetical protein